MLTCEGEGHDLPEVRSGGRRAISNPAMVYVCLGEVPDWGQRPVPVLHDTYGCRDTSITRGGKLLHLIPQLPLLSPGTSWYQLQNKLYRGNCVKDGL